jgi:serine/threonine-protein kinase BUR1
MSFLLSDMLMEVDKKARKRGSVYMVTPYMDHDLAGLLENPHVRLKVPHIKSYMKQLLQGTAYLHEVLLTTTSLTLRAKSYIET